jgi:6,7-dimethyl-8-ribityllumazine synthase
MLAETVRILVVEARYYEAIAHLLLAGAEAALTGAQVEFDVVSLPGVLEIPAVVAMAEEDGHRPAGVRYDGYVALGAVIREDAPQFQPIAGEAARALMDLSIGKRLAIGNGVLLTDTESQARALADPSQGDAGGAAAKACLAVIDVRRRLLGLSR